jgi:hypothetical protein
MKEIDESEIGQMVKEMWVLSQQRSSQNPKVRQLMEPGECTSEQVPVRTHVQLHDSISATVLRPVHLS